MIKLINQLQVRIISDIKGTGSQEQSNLILIKLTVDSQLSERQIRIDKLEESLTECENVKTHFGSLQNSVFSSSQKVCQFRTVWKARRLCLRTLDVDDGDDSEETSDDVFDKCTALNCLMNWNLIFQVPVLTGPIIGQGRKHQLGLDQ